MLTEILDTSEGSLRKARDILSNGGLVAFPTETVYGLGASGLDSEAVKRVFEAKGRPQDNPLILHISRGEDFDRYAKNIPEYARLLIDTYTPGPLTLVLEKRDIVPDIITAGLDTVCLRIPHHRATLDLLDLLDFPLAGPSANLSGRPSPTLASHVFEDLDGRIDAIIDGGPTDIGIESTVLDCTGATPVILREGVVTREMIEDTLGYSLVETHISSKRSPGTMYRHYAPVFPIEIVSRGWRGEILDEVSKHDDRAFIFYDSEGRNINGKYIYYFRDQGELSRSLFALFRSLEKSGIKKLYIEEITTGPLALALMNRIEKAAYS